MNKTTEYKSPIKLICMDMDGTLLDSYNKNNRYHLPERNIEAIRKAVAHGIHVCFSTARNESYIKPFAKIIGIEDQYYISNNGARISLGDKTLQDYPLSGEILRKICKVLKENNIYCEFYLDDVIYVDKLAKDAEKKPNIYRLPSIELGDAVYEMPLVTKLSICMENKEDQPRLTKLIQDIEGSENLIIFPSVGLHIEINSTAANKGDTVKWIANHLGISLDQVMAIGDAENDIPMLNVAGYPVVMGQANENMKKGRLVTARVEDAGVAVAIEKYCFGIDN